MAAPEQLVNTVIERFSGFAEHYDLGRPAPPPALAELLCGLAGVDRPQLVIDLGCGSGAQAAGLCEQVGPGGFIYGLDLTNAMIVKAQQQYRYANLAFILGDMHHIPLKDGAIDIVLSNCVINHAADKRQVFAEIYRVLKSGGHFLVGDVMAVEKLPPEVSSNPENIAACWGGAIPKSEYLSLIKNVGFSRVQELSKRQYYKHNFLLESIILKGEKHATDHQG
jgi:ubiquinone/menaquinone biosynthesis C-methylase UbiE